MKQEPLRFKNLQALISNKDTLTLTGNWVLVDQSMINAFAEATQDYQWIHVDQERCKTESPFKKTIAHGFLSVSLLSTMLMDMIIVDTISMGVNYGLNKVRFPHPVPVDSMIRLHCSITATEPYGDKGIKITWDCKTEIKDVDKPACVAEFVSLMFEK